MVLSLLLINGCAMMNDQNSNNYFMDKIIIRNLSNGILSQVKLKVEQSHGVISCGKILQQSECSSGFRKRPYKNNWVNISWERNGKRFTTENIKVSLNKNIKMGVVMKAIIEIRNDNELSAYFTN